MTYLDRHKRLDELLFIHQSEADKVEIQGHEVSRFDGHLITRVELQLVRRSAANKAENADSGCKNCVVDGCRVLVSESHMGHVNNGHDERELW